MEQQAFPGGMEEHMSNGLLEVTGLDDGRVEDKEILHGINLNIRVRPMC